MDKESLKALNEIKNILNKQITLESVFFDEDNSFEENEGTSSDEEYTDDMPNENESLDFSETVNSIRETALKGVTKFANNPSSQEYDFFKKIWNMCDKFANPKQKDDSE